ncbi:MAG TPA: hypothetical protein VHT91_00260 [Kofleriaceae bacterium]|jgi:hypothetical protein|nr:hypothetical protein [Kofleriaceae bacterium]
MKKTVKPLKVRKLKLDKETLRELVLGAAAIPTPMPRPIPVPFTQASCIVSQCPNTCSNIFETCA